MGEHLVYRPTITISASPNYSSGDAINTGAIALTPFPRPAGKLVSLTLRDAANQGPALLLLFFRSNPTSSTITDNAAFALHADDLTKHCGTISVLAADWQTVDSKSLAVLGDMQVVHSCAGVDAVGAVNNSLYLVIVANGAYNAAATTDLSIELEYERLLP